MYKTIFLIIALAVSLSLVESVSAEEIPNWVKSKIKLWALDKVDDKSFVDSLVELNKRDFIQFEKLKPVQTTYNLPKYGETVFVKISGRTEILARQLQLF